MIGLLGDHNKQLSTMPAHQIMEIYSYQTIIIIVVVIIIIISGEVTSVDNGPATMSTGV